MKKIINKRLDEIEVLLMQHNYNTIKDVIKNTRQYMDYQEEHHEEKNRKRNILECRRLMLDAYEIGYTRISRSQFDKWLREQNYKNIK